MPKRPQERTFAVNKTVSLPLNIVERIYDRSEEYNRTFSEEVTSLIRLGLRVIDDAAIREGQKE